MPGIEPSALQSLFYLISQWAKYDYYHFTDNKSKPWTSQESFLYKVAQRICNRSGLYCTLFLIVTQ
jgi:hypothetical protein